MKWVMHSVKASQLVAQKNLIACAISCSAVHGLCVKPTGWPLQGKGVGAGNGESCLHSCTLYTVHLPSPPHRQIT